MALNCEFLFSAKQFSKFQSSSLICRRTGPSASFNHHFEDKRKVMFADWVPIHFQVAVDEYGKNGVVAVNFHCR